MGTGKVPTIDPGGATISTQAKTAMQDPQVASTTGRMFFNLGAGMEDVSAQLEKAHTLAETTKAENALALKTAEIKQRAANDTDTSPEGRKKYHDELTRAASETAEGISLPYAKDIFSSKAQSQTAIDKFDIDNSYRKRVIDQGKANAAVFLDAQRKSYIETNSMGMKENAILRRNAKIDEMISSGFLSREDGAELKIKSQKQWDKEQILYHAQMNPQQTIDELKKGENGFYKGIDPESRADGLHKSEVQLRQDQHQSKQAEYIKRQDKVHELTMLSNSNLLTGPILEEAFITKQISNTTYKSLQENLDSPVGPTASTDNKTYYDITTQLAEGKLKPEEAVEKILDANTKGKLSKVDAKKIYEMHLTPNGNDPQSLADIEAANQSTGFDKMNNGFNARLAAIKDKQGWISSALKNFRDYYTGVDKEAQIAVAHQKLSDSIQRNKVQNKDIPAEADKVIAQDMLKKHPEWGSLPKEGKKGKDRHGNPVIVYPDGRVVRDK